MWEENLTTPQTGSVITNTLTNSTTTNQNVVYTVTPTSVRGTCNGPNFTVTVTVTPNANVASVTGTTPLCVGDNANYTAGSVVLGGGTGAWSSSDELVATVNPTTGVVTAIADGTCNIIYTITGGCGGTPTAQQALTVSSAVGDPAVFGDNIWNVYAYNVNNLDLTGTTIPRLLYRMKPQHFDTRNKWGIAVSPSSA